MQRGKTHFSRFVGIIFFSIIMISCLQNSVSALETYKFERLWPVRFSVRQFNAPWGMAIDDKGYFYVADSNNHRIQKMTSVGVLVTNWGKFGNGDGEFNTPCDIAVDNENGFVYVADTGNHRIQKFTLYGEFIAQWGEQGNESGQFDSPRSVAYDNDGFVYVADTNNHRIQKFTSKGEYITQWGNYGNGDGKFNAPNALAVNSSGDIYVVDTNNARIQRFNSQGEFLVKFGNYGSCDRFGITANPGCSGIFIAPYGIAIDKDDNVYVTDEENGIQKFGPNGEILWLRGEPSSELPPQIPVIQFYQGTDESGMVEIYLDIFMTHFSSPKGITIDNNGNIYVADTGSGGILVYDSLGYFVQSWQRYNRWNGEFYMPKSITINDDGSVYVADSRYNRVQKFTQDGQFVNKWPTDQDDGFRIPGGSVVDANGFMLVADVENHRILKFAADGALVEQWGALGNGPGQFNQPKGLAIDTLGYIYVADSGNNRIQKLTIDGVYVTEWGDSGDLGELLNQPHDIAIAGGYVYVTDTGNNKIRKYDPNGLLLTTWQYFDGANGTTFNAPKGIAVNSNGEMFITDAGNHRMLKFDPQGQLLSEFGGLGSAPGKLNDPTDVALFNGKVYVVDTNNHRVQVFRQGLPTDKYEKAIIIAGRRPDNDLWDETQTCANLAYKAMLYQGFTKDTIRYLSSNTQLDLDNNGEYDEVDGDATLVNISAGFEWAADADSLVLYLIDHGGQETFRLNIDEILDASFLAGELNALQEIISGAATVVIEACHSGSFLAALAPPADKERIIISSALADEDAYFLNTGAISFSSYFWANIFTGLNVNDAFNIASQAINRSFDNQHPLLDDSGNGIGNETPGDGDLALNTFIGNGAVIHGDIPVVGSVSPDKTINDTSTATIYAQGVTDDNGIERVWAVVRPPDYNLSQADNPVRDLPAFDLHLVDGATGYYEAAYQGFNIQGTYLITVYARDDMGNVSIPKLTSVTVNNPLHRRAVIMASEPSDTLPWTTIAKNVKLACEALSFQGYSDDDVYIMSPNAIDGVTYSTVAPTLDSLNDIGTWAAQQTRDVVVYMIGAGGFEEFYLNSDNTLTASHLDTWLDTLQGQINGQATVINDSCLSGSFLTHLTPPDGQQRIVITSTSDDQPALFEYDGEISFSGYFWRGVFNGLNVRDAFINAKAAIRYATLHFNGGAIIAQIDDNGNGEGNNKDDGRVAIDYTIGVGILLAGDGPLISGVAPELTLDDGSTTATIYAENVTTTGELDKVWALITTPDDSQAQPETPVTGLLTIELEFNAAAGRYEKTYDGFSSYGIYGITIYASDTQGNISSPMATRVKQAANYGDCLDTINLGDSIQSFWNVNCNSVHGSARYALFYTFTLDQETEVQIDLESVVDSYLYLLNGDQKDGADLASDYDSGEGFNPRIIKVLSPGSYTIEAKTYEEDEIGDFTLTLNTAAPPGSLTVIITPPEVVNADARWQIDGSDDWMTSGSTVPELRPGTYTVTFNNISGWDEPADKQIVVVENQTALYEFAYTEETQAVFIPIIVTDGDYSETQTIGVDPTGDDWCDSNDDYDGPPPLPIICIGDCPIVPHAEVDQCETKHILGKDSMNQEISFVLDYRYQDNTQITLYWEPTDLTDAWTYTITDNSTGQEFWLDMAATDHLAIASSPSIENDLRIVLEPKGQRVVALDGGAAHTVALKDNGSVWTWGSNQYGQLGDGSTTSRATPMQVADIINVQAIAAGGHHTSVLRTDGTLRVWGSNFYGQLGDGTTTDRLAPISVAGLNAIKAIANGLAHSLALKEDGTVWAWGANEHGQLGDGSTDHLTTPLQVSNFSGVAAIAAGAYHTAAIKEDGSVWTWGANDQGQLGDGTTQDRHTPVNAPGLNTANQIAAGYAHTIALKTDGSVWAWGANAHGQLGDGSNQASALPIRVDGLEDIVAIAAGGYHSIALRQDGAVFTWGFNGYGQLGDGTQIAQSTPVQITAVSDLIVVAGGFSHTMTLKADHSVWTWGDNNDGQLGDSSTTDRFSPVMVAGLPTTQSDQGAVTVTLSPQEAINAGAQWRLAGGEWMNSGATLYDLPTGTYTIEYKPLPRWEPPASAVVTIDANETESLNAAYLSQADSFISVYGGPVDETLTAAAITADDGLILAGWTDSSDQGGRDFQVIKLDRFGQIQWQKAYGGASDDMAASVQQTQNGGYIVAGETYPDENGYADIILIKLDPNGAVEWQQTYGGPLGEANPAVLQATNGDYLVAAQSASFGNNAAAIWVMRLDINGAVQWQFAYPDTSLASSPKIEATVDGGFVISAAITQPDAQNDWRLMKLGGDGQVQWTRTYGGDRHEYQPVVRALADGGLMAAGTTHSFGNGVANIWLSKLDSNGQIEWQKSIGEQDTLHNLADLRLTQDGNFIIAANRITDLGAHEIALFKLDSSGRTIWQKSFNAQASGAISASMLHQTSTGDFLVAGNGHWKGNDMIVLKIASDGQLPACGLNKDIFTQGIEALAVETQLTVQAELSDVMPAVSALPIQNTNLAPYFFCEPASPDIFETDDSLSRAVTVDPENPVVQHHNFHDGGDQDWVHFYGLAGETYTIEAFNLEANCDVVIVLYDADGNLIFEIDDDWEGGDESLDYAVINDGDYYVLVRQYDPNIFGLDTGYDLKVVQYEAPDEAIFEGDIVDNLKQPINAVVTPLDFSCNQCTLTGSHFIIKTTLEFYKEYHLTVSSDGYYDETYPVVLFANGTVWISPEFAIDQQFMLNPIPTGPFTINLSPSSVVNDGAWRVDGGVWKNSGEKLHGLLVGDHSVSYRAVTGWDPPETETVHISAGETVTLSRSYVAQTGSLTVNILPEKAAQAGALWQISGGLKRNSGYTETGLTPGQYTVTFDELAGWRKPLDIEDVDIKANQTTTINALFYSQVSADINNDGYTDLKDAIVGLQVLTGFDANQSLRDDYIDSGVDINGDDQIGMAEVIYILQTLVEQ